MSPLIVPNHYWRFFPTNSIQRATQISIFPLMCKKIAQTHELYTSRASGQFWRYFPGCLCNIFTPLCKKIAQMHRIIFILYVCRQILCIWAIFLHKKRYNANYKLGLIKTKYSRRAHKPTKIKRSQLAAIDKSDKSTGEVGSFKFKYQPRHNFYEVIR